MKTEIEELRALKSKIDKWAEVDHKKICNVCKRIKKVKSLEEFELKYITWTAIDELINEYGVSEFDIKFHAGFYDLFKLKIKYRKYYLLALMENVRRDKVSITDSINCSKELKSIIDSDKSTDITDMELESLIDHIPEKEL